VRPYDTWSEKYENSDYYALYFEPCNDDAKCSDKAKVFGALQGHKMRMRYRKKDDKDNTYWVETTLPSVGKAMSIYIREVTTIDEDFHYVFGYAFLGLFRELSETPGVTRSYEIGNIINEHEPALDRVDARFSVSVYFRQDPFKQTIYIRRFNILYLAA